MFSKNKSVIRSALVLNRNNLGNKVISGASFMFISIAMRTLITIGSMSVLARLLTPKDFGYVAMATVVTEFAVLLGGFGLANILIQRRVITRLQIDTVFWTGALSGTVLFILTYIFSFFTSLIFADPFSGELLRVLGVTFFFGGLTHVPEAMISRLMRFKTDFWIQLFIIAFRSVTAIVFALFGWGAWSLVAGSIGGSIASVLILYWVIPYVPRFRFNLSYLTSNWKTSGSYLSSGFVYYINMNVDLMLIGRALGASSLGYYQNARSLCDEVRGRIAVPLQRVLFPALSAIQSEQSRLQSSIIKSSRLLAALVIPIGMGISAVSDELVPVLYGSQWLAMIPILKTFGVGAAVKGSTAISTSLFNSQNKVSLGLKHNVIGCLMLVVSIFVAIPYGIDTVALAVAVSSFYGIVMLYASFSLIGLGIRHVIVILGIPFFCSSMMWLAIYFLRDFYSKMALNIPLNLFLLILSGALVYCCLLVIVSPSYINDVKRVLHGIIHRNQQGALQEK